MRMVLLIIILFCTPRAICGQPESGHITYALISYVLYDTTKVKEEDVPGILEVIGDEFKAEVYYNKDWLVVIRQNGVKQEKKTYDRTNRILYFYTDSPDKKMLIVDSLLVLKVGDPLVSAAKDTLRASMKMTEWSHEKQTIAGWGAYKMSFMGLYEPTSLDEIWKSGFGDVPNFIFPENFYFLNNGLPVRIIQDIEGIRFTWGIVSVKSISRLHPIFNKPEGDYMHRVFDSRSVVLEIAGYLEEDASGK
jgi:hypothetical protein